MKTILLLSTVLAIPAFAGSPAMETAPPAPAPCLFTWFAGGSIGYLTEFEEPMYNLHVGTDTCWNLGGWNVALFAEIGYTERDEDWSGRYVPPQTPPVTSVPIPDSSSDVLDDTDLEGVEAGLDELEQALYSLAGESVAGTGYELSVLPITFNVKLERPLTGNLNAYFGGGLGAALVDLDVNLGDFGNFSDDDWVFTGQLFAGLNYNFNPNFEVYGGVRWIYLDDPSLSDRGISGTLDLDDDFLFELGGRFNF